MIAQLSSSKKRGMGEITAKMKVVDLLYCLYLFAVVLMSTLGMSAADLPYIATVAIGGLFALVRILTSEYDARWFFAMLMLVLLAAIEYSVSKRFTFFLTVLLLVGARGMPTRTLLACFLVAKIIGLVLVGIFVVTGVFEVETFQYYKMATESFVQRVTVNGAATNVMHLSLLAVAFLIFYLKNGKVTTFYYLIFFALNFAFEQVTHSFLGLFLGTGGLFLFCALQHSSKIRAGFIRLSTAVLPLLLVFSFGTALLYGKSPFVDLLDRIFQGRIYYNHYFLTSTSISPFGHGMLYSEGNFDNSFIFVFVAYGLIAFVLLFGAMQVVAVHLKREKDWVALSAVVLYMLAGLSESFYPSAAVNPTLFMLIPLLSSDNVLRLSKQGA